MVEPGNLQSLNQLAREARASHIIHTGDFGFYDERSLDRIAEKCVTLLQTVHHDLRWSFADHDLLQDTEACGAVLAAAF